MDSILRSRGQRVPAAATSGSEKCIAAKPTVAPPYYFFGDEITAHVMGFANGGVRLGISAPKHIKVSRGDGKVTPLCETKRAKKRMDLKRLEGVMSMHHVMTGNQLETAVASDNPYAKQAVS